MQHSIERESSLNVRDFVQAADELSRLQEEHGIQVRRNLFERLGAHYLSRSTTNRSFPVDKKRYCLACLLGMFGVHHFYAGHWLRGLFYLLFCWTGITIGMAMIDWMAAVPKNCDEQGKILV